MQKRASSRYHFTAAGYPASYRQREAEIIVQKIRARESLLISSLAGSGKTHLLQFVVANQAFKQRYFSGASGDFVFFLFDCNAVKPDDAGLFRMMIAELGSQAGLDVANLLRGPAQTSEECVVALKECLNELYREDLTLVLVFDRFDKLLPSPHLSDILDQLRSLRDHFARRVAYVLAGRSVDNLSGLSDEFDDLLATPPVLFLPPLSQADVELAITLYENERGRAFDQTSRAWLIRLSGGHPRLLRAICDVWCDEWGAAADEATIARQLLSSGRIRQVCRDLWEDIPPPKQRSLCDAAGGGLVWHTHGFLAQHGLVQVDQSGQPRIFSTVFAAYVGEWGKPQFSFDLKPPSVVKIDDTRVNLTPQEYRFLEALWKTPGDAVANDDILSAVYPQETLHERELPGLARRVRSKINVVPGHEFIVNVRGVGYLLDIGTHTARKRT